MICSTLILLIRIYCQWVCKPKSEIRGVDRASDRVGGGAPIFRNSCGNKTLAYKKGILIMKLQLNNCRMR